MDQEKPYDARSPLAQEGEIVGRPTLLATYASKQDHKQIISKLQELGYPTEDVSVLLRLQGSDQVLDQITGKVAAGQSINDEDVARSHASGQTIVLMHPSRAELDAVEAALKTLGPVDLDYASETHAYGRLGGVERKDIEIP